MLKNSIYWQFLFVEKRIIITFANRKLISINFFYFYFIFEIAEVDASCVNLIFMNYITTQTNCSTQKDKPLWQGKILFGVCTIKHDGDALLRQTYNKLNLPMKQLFTLENVSPSQKTINIIRQFAYSCRYVKINGKYEMLCM